MAVGGSLEDVLEVVVQLEPLGLFLGLSALVPGPGLRATAFTRGLTSAAVDGGEAREILGKCIYEGSIW